MANIKLQLDSVDVQFLSRFTVFLDKDGFPCIALGQRSERQVRVVDLILGDVRRKRWVDYKDGDKLNLKRVNLLITNKTAINYRLKKRRNTTSQYKGVSWHKHHEAWRAYASNAGKQYHLGFFDNEEDARVAHDEFIENLLATNRRPF